MGFLFLLGAFFGIAKGNGYRVSGVIDAPEACLVDVTITGAVRKPGVYSISSGTTIREILQKVRPSFYADLKEFSLDQPIEAPISLEIPELKEILVFIQGDGVQPKELVLPAGTRVCDLKSKVSLNMDADQKILKSRRKLKNREKIEIFKKTVEQK